MIHFTCPCGKALHAREEYAGQTTRCPQCGRDLPIPDDRAIAAEAPPREAPREGGRRGRRDRDGGRDREGRPRPPSTSGMAVASAILGVVSLLSACVCAVLTGPAALILGGLSLRAIGRSEGRLQGKGLAITGLVTGGLSLLILPFLAFFVWSWVHDKAATVSSANNLKDIGVAMHDYSDTTGTFPPAAICDQNGKPLLSWRVAILPYVEGDYLYKQFKLDEPWDGPNNSKLLTQMPKVYALPGDTTAPPGYTYYRVFVGNGAAFDGPKPGHAFGVTPGVSMSEFANGDGMANTVLVAEAATAVPWTKPDELPFDPVGPLPPLGGHYRGGFQALMADGAVHWVSTSVSEQTLRAAITRNGGEVLGPDW